ncbi:hypothetical protein LCGC14_2538570, partial [marine sediment metagenome]
MKVRVIFKFEKETKGAVRYQEVDEDTMEPLNFKEAFIGTIYLRKAQIEGIAP